MSIISIRSLRGWISGIGLNITLKKAFRRRRTWILSDIGLDLQDISKTLVYLQHPEKNFIEKMNLIDFVSSYAPVLLPEDQYGDIDPR